LFKNQERRRKAENKKATTAREVETERQRRWTTRPFYQNPIPIPHFHKKHRRTSPFPKAAKPRKFSSTAQISTRL
jgi:hypothetical protein